MSYFEKKSLTASGTSLCAYLIALAGFQKGLKVSFYYNDHRTKKYTPNNGRNSEVFSLSDGETTHYFCRSKGNLTKRESGRIASDKLKCKKVLQQSGIPVPRGCLIPVGNSMEFDPFIELACDKLVVKPVSGSMGKGVFTSLSTIDEVNSALYRNKKSDVLIEQQVEGEEYRFYVVDDEVVAVTGRDCAHVIGDGKQNIRQLIKNKNALRAMNPHLSSRLIKINSNLKDIIATHGYSLNSIPENGEKIYLSHAANLSLGGDSVDATFLVSEEIKKIAVDAAKAVGLPNVGIDIIVSKEEDRVVPYIIELNYQAHIGSHTFPMHGSGQGNRVAETIVDLYFPKIKKRKPKGIYFDFSYIKNGIKEGRLSCISLPVIYPNMTQRWIKFSTDTSHNTTLELLEKLLRKHNLHCELTYLGDKIYSFKILSTIKIVKSILEQIESSLRNFEILDNKISTSPMELGLSIRNPLVEDEDIDYQDLIARKVLIRGRVHQVGFRKWLSTKAKDLGVNGWVRNRSDGTVEALFLGKVSHVLQLLEDCREGIRKAYVDEITVSKTKFVKIDGFRIRKTL